MLMTVRHANAVVTIIFAFFASVTLVGSIYGCIGTCCAPKVHRKQILVENLVSIYFMKPTVKYRTCVVFAYISPLCSHNISQKLWGGFEK